MLAHATHHDVHDGVPSLARSQRKRLVTRLSHPSDPRANAISLTAIGAKTTSRAFPLALRAKNEFFGALGSEERATTDAGHVDLIPVGDNGWLRQLGLHLGRTTTCLQGGTHHEDAEKVGRKRLPLASSWNNMCRS